MNIPFVKKNELYSFVDKNFIYVVIVSVVIVVFFFTYFFIVPTWKDIREVNVLELGQKQDQLTQLQSFLSQLKSMRDRYAQIDYNDIQRIDSILPKGFDKQQLFLQLEQLGTQNNLEVTSITFSDRLASGATPSSRRTSQSATSATSTSSVGSVEQVSVTMRINGIDSYDAFKKFLLSVEAFGPILTISSIEYPVSSKSYDVTLTTYYLSES